MHWQGGASSGRSSHSQVPPWWGCGWSSLSLPGFLSGTAHLRTCAARRAVPLFYTLPAAAIHIWYYPTPREPRSLVMIWPLALRPLRQRIRGNANAPRLRTYTQPRTQPTQLFAPPPFAAGAQLAAHTQSALRAGLMAPAWRLLHVSRR